MSCTKLDFWLREVKHNESTTGYTTVIPIFILHNDVKRGNLFYDCILLSARNKHWFYIITMKHQFCRTFR